MGRDAVERGVTVHGRDSSVPGRDRSVPPLVLLECQIIDPYSLRKYGFEVHEINLE